MSQYEAVSLTRRLALCSFEGLIFDGIEGRSGFGQALWSSSVPSEIGEDIHKEVFGRMTPNARKGKEEVSNSIAI